MILFENADGVGITNDENNTIWKKITYAQAYDLLKTNVFEVYYKDIHKGMVEIWTGMDIDNLQEKGTPLWIKVGGMPTGSVVKLVLKKS